MKSDFVNRCFQKQNVPQIKIVYAEQLYLIIQILLHFHYI